MNKDIDGQNIDDFDLFLKYYNQDILSYDERDFDICYRLSSLNFDKYEGTKLKYCRLKKMFYKAIESLGTNTKDFYLYLPNLRIKRRRLACGYAEIVGNNKKQDIYLNDERLKDKDFVAFCHEMGHIPTIKNGALFDYFEYSEVLSIFFEYLASIYIDKEHVPDLFLNNRLEISSMEALMFLEANDMKKDDNSITDKLLLNEMRECYKYIISFEYALNLVELYKNDRNLLNDNIDRIVNGESSFKEFENEYNLNIKKYKILKKHI